MKALLIRLLVILPLWTILIVAKPVPAQASGASFYLSPSGGTYNVGDTVRVTLLVNTGGQAINAEQASLSWSGLTYSFLSQSGSINQFWTEGPSAGGNSASFAGGLSTPGYNGSGGRILQLIFTASAPGTATVNVNGIHIYANDSSSTDILCCSSGASFNIVTPKPATPLLTVNSGTHPDENKWYQSRKVDLNWFATTKVTGYYIAFDHNPGTDPTESVNGTTQTSYDNVDDGVWYFHVKGANESGGSTVHRRVAIDNVPPADFPIKVDSGGNGTNPTPISTFEATDPAGIDHYEAVIDDGAAFGITSGQPLPKQRPGEHSLLIRAFDGAGNVRESKTTFKIDGIDAPKILDWSKLVAIKEPIKFIGQSSADDTITVFLGDKQVDQFLARDKQVAKDRKDVKFSGTGGFDGGVTWEYVYSQPLFPGDYSFRFARTNKAGAESALTPQYKTKVVTGTVMILGRMLTGDEFNNWLKDLLWLLLLIIAFETGVIVHQHFVRQHLEKELAEGGGHHGVGPKTPTNFHQLRINLIDAALKTLLFWKSTTVAEVSGSMAPLASKPALKPKKIKPKVVPVKVELPKDDPEPPSSLVE
ncbi:MAG TPA: hypothetical protein VLF41_01975 [Candidatus Nanoarchaeia archaeon]|nr:hypothetical protein [Candidatus Nanoarchaeia archaeon]